MHPVETGAVVAIPQVVFNTAMSGARLKAAFLDAISIQGQACADARRHNGNELLFCSPIALADFSCFLTLQGTVGPTSCVCAGRFRPVCRIYDRQNRLGPSRHKSDVGPVAYHCAGHEHDQALLPPFREEKDQRQP